ncbi:outer membrane beta-barrel protein [Flavicella marina]|uniref:outer membrane beta-barrel protein n=1 Tax=Flavicella marina TaxID=1475951 RepID=UPI001264F0D2|nr:outer membrane beta-barrel protein [Flavicella marina]
MKKIILILLLVVSTGALAQKGSVYIGGALGYTSDNYKIAPEAGYWMAETLQLGAVLSYEKSTTANVDTKTFKPHVYFRKFYAMSDKFSLYAGANARYVSTDVAGVSSSYFDAFVDLGFAYSLADRWGVVGRVASIGLLQEEFTIDFDMSKQPLFNVGIYYTIKQ